ncbi:MAG: hypothetical protein O2899_07905 [Bacteroidetes bacterium]|nr:hypothetical protein [Bacteroidota bacterium]
MTPEEYERFKEAEKAHLRKLKELKQAHHQLQRKARVTRAVTDMAEGINSLYDEHNEMVERLQHDTIGAEARMEVALDNLAADDRLLENLDAAELEADQTLRKSRAQELIRQMKAAEGEAPDESDSSSAAPPASAPTLDQGAGSETRSAGSSSDLPEKTIGRMRR